MTDNQTFDQTLKSLRKKKGLTLEKLAKKVGTTKGYIWELENTKGKKPSVELVNSLAIALEVTIEHLISTPPKDEDDRVFFREYQSLSDDTKEKLKKIMGALKDT